MVPLIDDVAADGMYVAAAVVGAVVVLLLFPQVRTLLFKKLGLEITFQAALSSLLFYVAALLPVAALLLNSDMESDGHKALGWLWFVGGLVASVVALYMMKSGMSGLTGVTFVVGLAAAIIGGMVVVPSDDDDATAPSSA